jgi:glucoamylase
VFDKSLRGKLRLYALLAPHLAGYGVGNSGSCTEIGGYKLLHAQREDVHLLMTCSSGFSRRSVGYVGFSDGWQDLMHHFKMDWNFRSAPDGNIALTGEIDLPDSGEFTVAIALGRSYQSSATKLFQSLAEPFAEKREDYVRQWQRALINRKYDFSSDTSDDGGEYRLSRCVLLANEDKVFQGAIVASMSIPWGETKGDVDLGGYHLVWTRDLVQSATALLATGQTGTPLRALIWLAAIQRPDGSFPQNSWIDGTAYWSGLQLDQVAFPILLAWRLYKCHALDLFDPRVMIVRAAARLILRAPVTAQERWEENSGYSPSTLAVVIAALACTAEWGMEVGNTEAAEFVFAYADWLAAHLEEWTVTTNGELVEGIPRHYIRINPADPNEPDPHADPNTQMIQIANGGGLHPARNIVGADFLHFVRYGIRRPDDPLIVDSIKVVDHILKHDLPQGPGWRRYNHDGYGQKADGSAYDGTGVGRCWPILTGERGHYELAAGRDPKPFITTIEDFSNQGGMLTEQIWDGPDLPQARMKPGCPTGAAMPLCWSHAEYVSLVRSRHDGVCFPRVEPAYQRYVVNPVPNHYEMWTLRYPMRRMPHGKILRIILAEQASITWTTDNWQRTNKSQMLHQDQLNLWFADFPTTEWPVGSIFVFTIFWECDQRWVNRNWQVTVV